MSAEGVFIPSKVRNCSSTLLYLTVLYSGFPPDAPAEASWETRSGALVPAPGAAGGSFCGAAAADVGSALFFSCAASPSAGMVNWPPTQPGDVPVVAAGDG